MHQRRWFPKVRTARAIVVLAIALTSTSVAVARMTVPGTNPLDGGVMSGGGGGGPSTESNDPFSKPVRPDGPILDERTATSIRFHWWDLSSYESGYEVHRAPAYGGPWTRLAAWGPYNGGAVPMSYTDTTVSSDTLYYYKVRVYNLHGESSAIQAFSTLDGRGVSRLQLRMRTANVADADTDDDVNVAIKDYEPDGTWLDYGRDDFERGDEFTYELLSEDVTDLSDIHQIHILKPGTDGWCLENLALLVDGVEVYEQHFGATAATCRWLDDASGHQNYLTIGRDTLRAHPLWQAYQKPAATGVLPGTELADRIEATVGDIIHDGVYVDAFPLYQGTLDVSWTDTALDGERHVKISRRPDAEAVHVELALDIDTPGPGGLTGGLSFDLRFTGVCRTATEPAKILIKPERIQATADFDWTTEAMTLWLVNLGEGSIADRIKDSLPDFSQTITVNDPVNNQIVTCITPIIGPEGDVVFLPTFGPAPGTGGGTLPNGPGRIDGTRTTGTITTGGTSTTGTGTLGSKTRGSGGNTATPVAAK